MQFSLDSITYTKFSTNKNYQVAYATCYLRINMFYIMNGYCVQNNPLGEISGCDLETDVWTVFTRLMITPQKV
jgi:hypothetical protein